MRCHSLSKRGAAGDKTHRAGAEWFVFEVPAPYDQSLWENGDRPMCLSAQHPESERGRGRKRYSGAPRLFPVLIVSVTEEALGLPVPKRPRRISASL